MFPCKYHQKGGFSMAMLVLGRVGSVFCCRYFPTEPYLYLWWFELMIGCFSKGWAFHCNPVMKSIGCRIANNYMKVRPIPSEWLMNELLGGGFNHFLFSPRSLGKWSNLTNILQQGWHHQLDYHSILSLKLPTSHGRDPHAARCKSTNDGFVSSAQTFFITAFSPRSNLREQKIPDDFGL